jgi:hypothetical protein
MHGMHATCYVMLLSLRGSLYTYMLLCELVVGLTFARYDRSNSADVLGLPRGWPQGLGLLEQSYLSSRETLGI